MNFKLKFVIELLIYVICAIFFGLNSDRGLFTGVLSVTTFLFSAIAISNIGNRQKRMELVRDHNSVVRSALTQIYFLSSVWGKKKQDEVKQLIDEYLVSIFMFRKEDQDLTNPYFSRLYNTVLKLDTKGGSNNSSAYGSLNTAFGNLMRARQELLALFQDNLSKFELWISTLLGLIILATLLVVNTGTIVSIILISCLAGAIIFLLNLSFALEALDYGYEQRIIEPYQKTLEEIGLLRYYPEEFIEDGFLEFVPETKPYRVGRFKNPYPNIEGFSIDVINPADNKPA